MERQTSDEHKPARSPPKVDLKAGVTFTLRRAYDEDKPREPLTTIEPIMTTINSVGQFDRTKRYVSEKPVDATIKTSEAAMETTSCAKDDASTQYEEQKLNAEAIQRICASQKMEKFIKECGTM
ncbi:hypothetical protein AAVH_00106 [Aphelenchoides avenae]|nr:hypothetical protein AAVH_00106 [Aphelenchus avenae]